MRSHGKRPGASAMLVIFLAATGTAAIAAPAWKTFGDGTYRVGKDVPAGTYRSRGGDGCYWQRLKSFSGGFGAIIANANPRGPALVTILPTDKGFETNDCGTWTSNLARITKSKTRFGEGTYIVKVDIAPGTYRTREGDGCYWARLRAFTGGFGAIVANGNPTGSAIVTIAPSDKGFESNDCGTWSRL